MGRVYPDDWMPVDKYGIRADLWLDMNSPVARNNPSQLYEMGINRISEFARRQIKETYEVKGSEPAFEMLMDWYGDVNPNYEKLVREVMVTPKQRDSLTVDAIETSPKIWIPPFLNTLTPNKDDFWNALENIKSWAAKWGCKPSPVTYKTLQADGTGKEFTTLAHFSIGSKYILRLDKIPEVTAPGPASVNHVGIPTKSTYESKHFPVSTNPYKFGEDEMRMISMDSDIREVTRFINLYSNSSLGVIKLVESLLTSEHPSRIKRTPISNGELHKTSSVNRLIHNTAAVLGVETKKTKVEGFEVDDELSDAIWSAEIAEEGGRRGGGVFSDAEDGVTRRSANKRSKAQKALSDLGDDPEDADVLEDAEG